MTHLEFKVCAKVCAGQNGRRQLLNGPPVKLLKNMVPASRFELLTPRV